jgi:3-hydroxyacyl-CoA dehydrogenase
MVNEAFHLLGEGIVASDRPGDIDTCLCLGFGFPAWRGGPLFWAEHCVPGGLPAVEASLARLAAAFPAGAADLVPAPLLKALVLRGLGIWDLQDRPWLVGELLRGASARL